MSTLNVDFQNPGYLELRLACSSYTVDNLKAIDKKQATALILLFQQNVSFLPSNDFNAALGTFRKKFPEINVEALFLKELLPHCQNDPENSFLLIEKASQWFTAENLSFVSKRIETDWIALFKTFKVTAICSKQQEYDLPRCFVQSCKMVQKLMHCPLRFETTSITVLKVFEKFLYEGKIEGDPFFKDPHLWVQLFDLGRRFENVALQTLSYEKLIEIDYSDLSRSLTCIQKGEFEKALKSNPDDSLSHEALGEILLKENDFIGAWKHFQKGYKLAPFRFDLYLMQARALLGYIKHLKKDYLESIKKILDNFNLNKEIKTDLIKLLQALKNEKLIEGNVKTFPLLKLENFQKFSLNLKLEIEKIRSPYILDCESVLKKFTYLFEKEAKVPQVFAEFQLLKKELQVEKELNL